MKGGWRDRARWRRRLESVRSAIWFLFAAESMYPDLCDLLGLHPDFARTEARKHIDYDLLQWAHKQEERHCKETPSASKPLIVEQSL